MSNPLTLSSLPEDALISILCRVPASDHKSLWDTCSTFRKAIDSDVYASERATTNYAEVQARLIPGEELYDRNYPDGPELYDGEFQNYEPPTSPTTPEEIEMKNRYEAKLLQQRQEDINEWYTALGHREEYGVINITVDITVDNVLAGEVSLVLIPRPRHGVLFHQAGDAHSSELQQVTVTLCDRRGRPKNRSIKNADTDGTAKRGGFLHVKSVRIRRQAYKSGDNTNIVARAVRAALKVPELHGKWTLAAAWCDPMTYATSELERKRRDITRGNWATEEDITEEQAEQNKKVINRWNECINLDARTFLRAGYKQVMEVFGKGENPWLFALPEFLDAPLLSHEDAMGIHLRVWPTNLPPSPSGVDEKLFNAVTKALTSMSFHDVDNTKAIEHTVRSEDEMMARSISEFNQMEAKLASLEQDHEEALRELDEAETHISTKRANMHTSRSQLAILRNEGRPEEELNEFETSIQEALALYDEMDSKLEVSRRAIEEKGRLIENTRSEFESNSSVGLMRKHANATFEERCAERRNELLDKIRRRIEKLKVEVRNLVNEGASVRKAYALHCSARFLNTELLDFFIGLVPSNERTSAINDLDENGMTPLICSVMKAPERVNEADKYYNTVQHLLRLGSDKSTVDPHGRTALGQYRMSVCSMNDYFRTFSIQQLGTNDEWAPIHSLMEAALMPMGGETEADKDAKDRGDEPVSSDDDDDDWDDIMDDEYDMDEEDWLEYGEGL